MSAHLFAIIWTAFFIGMSAGLGVAWILAARIQKQTLKEIEEALND